ncbi:MAG: NAD kinase [Thiobacillaceae bacterium]
MNTPFRTVALVSKYDSAGIAESVLCLARFLVHRGYQVVIARQTAEKLDIPGYRLESLTDIGHLADVAVVLGGDGTILSIARVLAPFEVPIIGVNQGRLGFLTDISLAEMETNLAAMLTGKFHAENRILLNARVIRDREIITEACAFNDVVVSKGGAGRLIEIEVSIDEEFVYSQRSDGLVVATPTGSTAYALSAGGPILHPTLDAIVLVPICPHSFSARPIAINGDSHVQIQIMFADDCRVHFDGQRNADLKVGDQVQIYRAVTPATLLHPLDHSYYSTLRQKLHWGHQL